MRVIASACIALLLFSAFTIADMKDDGRGLGTLVNPYLIPRVETTVTADGLLNETVWDSALTIELNYETSPGENTKPPVRTEVLLAYDQRNLYVAFRCYDPEPGAIRARLSDRDSFFWDDDAVSISLDTFNDELNAFDFICNPFGIQTDSNWGGGSWDAIWDSAGRITDWGYAVEMIIPFKVLRFPRVDGPQVWGFNAGRFLPRSFGRTFELVPINRDENCYVCQFAKIKGFDGISPGRDIEFTPELTAARSEAREDFPFGPIAQSDSAMQIGLTTRWGITPGFNILGLADADFSQVEADSIELDINRRFPIYYSEKRPFFLEGNEFFWGIHTRNISNPVWGAKLTGKEGGNSIGVLLVQDEVTRVIFPESDGAESTYLARENRSLFFRYKRDIGRQSTIGISYNRRDADNYYNRVISVDANLRLNSNDSMYINYIGSGTSYDPRTSEEFDQPQNEFGGHSYSLSYVHSTRNWYSRFAHNESDSDFRNDMSSIFSVGTRGYSFSAGPRWYGDGDSFFTNISVDVHGSQSERQNGSLIDRDFGLDVSLSMPAQSSFFYSYRRGRENHEALSTVQNNHSLSFHSQPRASFGLGLGAWMGDGIDWEHLREGISFNYWSDFLFNIGKHLKLNMDYSLSRFSVGSERLYLINNAETHATYQFNSRMFFRAILQYFDVRQNPKLYESEVDPISRSFYSQFLFSLKINPRTVLFIGYSDSYHGTQDFSITRSDRSVFIKMSYAWVL